MSARSSERLTGQIDRAQTQLNQLRARQLAKEMRAEAQARLRARREIHRRHMELGRAVEGAGCADWDLDVLVGALLTERERMEQSPTLRGALRERGMRHRGLGEPRHTVDSLVRTFQ